METTEGVEMEDRRRGKDRIGWRGNRQAKRKGNSTREGYCTRRAGVSLHEEVLFGANLRLSPYQRIREGLNSWRQGRMPHISGSSITAG